ncbi:hypothetical protein [Kutzneria sp. CA-103260]|uniref:hypothetical protein n=1 Tax=Kutzneria sp. CA-103260 TaxID=2802641 RepID=UPI001BA46026|nr:hypothetical protein [Kutzneria sp. CA-103260]QUQ63079.1 hypothetical protein JJ691_07910 [Kutzneria sp. CA-103260]
MPSVENPLQRRHFLAGMAVVAVAGTIGLNDAGAAAAADGRWTGALTQNGWPVLDQAPKTVRVQGSAATMTVVAGDVAVILEHVARRFHYEIESLAAGQIAGYRTDRAVATPTASNYLSGTAIAIRPDLFPPGAEGLFPFQVAVVRDILADCDGVVRWGGDDKTAAAQGHFQIDVRPGDPALHRVAAAVSGLAGLMPDPNAPDRLRRSRQLAARQATR